MSTLDCISLQVEQLACCPFWSHRIFRVGALDAVDGVLLREASQGSSHSSALLGFVLPSSAVECFFLLVVWLLLACASSVSKMVFSVLFFASCSLWQNTNHN
jgi:hypothetical protein